MRMAQPAVDAAAIQSTRPMPLVHMMPMVLVMLVHLMMARTLFMPRAGGHCGALREGGGGKHREQSGDEE